jgi:hypothetical protein
MNNSQRLPPLGSRATAKARHRLVVSYFDRKPETIQGPPRAAAVISPITVVNESAGRGGAFSEERGLIM